MASPKPNASVGSYIFEAPIALADPQLERLNAAVVVNPIDGSLAVAFRISRSQFDALDMAQIGDRLARRAAVEASGIAIVLESGITELGVFAIESPPASIRLSEQLASGREFSPFDTVNLIRELQASLALADMVHGQISSELIWLDETDRPVLGGFAFAEPSPGVDTPSLAALAFELLSGVRFNPAAFNFLAGVRTERVREALPGVTAQFAGVIAAGTGGKFEHTSDFATALAAAAADSAADLAAAAQQAIGVNDPCGANLFLDLGRRYRPDHAELTAVALRLSPASVRTAPPLVQTDGSYDESQAEDSYDPASEQARFLASLEAAIPELTTAKPKFPWFAIAAGLLGMFGIISVLAFVVVQSR